MSTSYTSFPWPTMRRGWSSYPTCKQCSAVFDQPTCQSFRRAHPESRQNNFRATHHSAGCPIDLLSPPVKVSPAPVGWGLRQRKCRYDCSGEQTKSPASRITTCMRGDVWNPAEPRSPSRTRSIRHIGQNRCVLPVSWFTTRSSDSILLRVPSALGIGPAQEQRIKIARIYR